MSYSQRLEKYLRIVLYDELVSSICEFAGIACGKEDKVKNWDDFEWEKRVVNNARLSDLVFSREHVDVVGAIVHRTPQTQRKDKLLRQMFEELKIPYAGAIPEDAMLRSVQVCLVIFKFH